MEIWHELPDLELLMKRLYDILDAIEKRAGMYLREARLGEP